MTTERHPLGFFLPEGARLLMLGSFPPPKARWSMDFFYPNIQNDMWRVMGLLFYADKDHFLATPKAFDRDKAIRFCRERGIALGDTAREVIRQKANASDKFLEVIVPIDLEAVLSELPACEAIVVTGQKALDTLLGVLASAEDPVVVEAPKGAQGRLVGDVRFRRASLAPLSHALHLEGLPQAFGREGRRLWGDAP